MSRHPSQPLQPLAWLGAPMLGCIVATLVFAAPLRVYSLSLPEPLFPMVLAFAWPVIRPSLIAPFALLAIGLFTDLFWGGPVGLWALSLLLAYVLALAARSLMAGQSGRVLWGWYAAMSLLAFGFAYLFTLMGSKVVPTLTGVALQALVTIALYPLAHRLIDRFEDADVRFR